MKLSVQKFKKFVMLQKEGWVVGSIFGALVAAEYTYHYVDKFLVMLQVPVTPMMSFTVLIVIGGMAGILTDSLYKPKQ